MNEASKHWLGAFGGLRVPFDPKIIFLGFLAVIIFVGGVTVINLFAEQEYLVSRTLYTVASYLGTNAVKAFNVVYALIPGNRAAENILQQPPSLRVIVYVLVWAIFVWSIFAGMISRITAYRIAKDDALSIGNALKFTWRHKFSLFLTPFCIALLIGVFYMCNWLAGYMVQLFPGIGPVLFVFPVFILVLISTLFIILLLIVLMFGLHLIASAIGVEGCDGTEAFINVFDYIYSRPWSYILYHASLAVSVLFLLWLGGLGIDLSFHSSSVSSDQKITAYHFSKQWETVEVSRIGHLSERYYLKRDAEQEGSEAEGLKYYQTGMKDVWAYIRQVHVYSWVYDDAKNETTDKLHTMQFNDLWRLDKLWACIGGALAFIYFMLQLGVWGYVFAYICAASTTIYFLLRKEVGSTDFDEIWEDEVQEVAAEPVKKEAKPKEKEAAKPAAVAAPVEVKKEEPKAKAEAAEPKKETAPAEPKKEAAKDAGKPATTGESKKETTTSVPLMQPADGKKEEAKPAPALAPTITTDVKKEPVPPLAAAPAAATDAKKEPAKTESKDGKPVVATTPAVEAKKEATSSPLPPSVPAVAPETKKETPVSPSAAVVTEAKKEPGKEEVKPKVDAPHAEPKKEGGLVVPVFGEAKKEPAKDEAKPKVDLSPVITTEAPKDATAEAKKEAAKTEPPKPVGIHFEPLKPHTPEAKPETKPEVKPEAKPEAKPETKPEVKKEEESKTEGEDGKKKDKNVETGTMAIPLIRRRGTDKEEKKPEEKKPEEKKDKKFMD